MKSRGRPAFSPGQAGADSAADGFAGRSDVSAGRFFWGSAMGVYVVIAVLGAGWIIFTA